MSAPGSAGATHIVMDECQKARFWMKVTETPTCFIWDGSTDRNGYGQVRIDGRLLYAHRVAYELWCGPIAEGLVLDHLCRVPCCVNPHHLEPVTQGENVRRGAGNGNREKTECKRGHAFTEENTIRTKTGRNCLTCRRDYDKARWARKKVAQ